MPLHWKQNLWGWWTTTATGDLPANKPFIWSIGTNVGIGGSAGARSGILGQYNIRLNLPYETPHIPYARTRTPNSEIRHLGIRLAVSDSVERNLFRSSRITGSGTFGVRRFITAFFRVAARCSNFSRLSESGDESPHSKRLFSVMRPRSVDINDASLRVNRIHDPIMVCQAVHRANMPISSETSRSINSRGDCGRRSGSRAVICWTSRITSRGTCGASRVKSAGDDWRC